ncbi:MAG: tetratricopeptide repeat protein [Elusimicrobiota bacterium]|nr:tetratricopeptide repeat protein [Elusimicrobiota bacterium]
MRRALLVVFLYCPAAHAAAARPAEDPSDGYQALDMEARAIMGELKLQSGDLSGARAQYGRSLELGKGVDTPKDDVAALNHYRSAEIALQRGEFSDAKRHLDILLTRYPRTDWGERGQALLESIPGEGLRKSEAAQADEPFVPAMPSSTPEEALGRLRAAVDSDRVEDGLAEGYDFRRRYPDHPSREEVELACAALHLRRGEPARAARLLQPLAQGRGRQRGRAVHMLGAAYTALGQDAAVLSAVPDADASAVADRWIALAQIWRAGAEERLGRREDAAGRFRAVSASGHDSPVRAYALAAVAADWDRKGRPDRARDALTRAAKEAARWGLDDLRESATLSIAHLLRRQGKTAEASSAYADFAARFPRSPLRPRALYERGLMLKKLGLVPQAVKSYQEIVDKHPGSVFAADAHLQLGQLLTEEGESEQALYHYKAMAKASEAKDADLEALLLMAQVHYNKKRYRDAVPLYKRYLESAAPGAKTKEVEGLLLNSVWQADRDDPELPALVARWPEHPLVRVIRRDLAASAYKRGDWAGAEALLRRQIETDPKSPRVHDWRYYRAEALRQLGHGADAADAYRRFLATAPPDDKRRRDAAARLGALLYEAGDHAGAARAYGAVTGDDAEAADAAYNRALALTKTPREDEAARALAAFATKFPDHEKAPWAWLTAAKSREDAGDLAGAARAYEQAKAWYPLGRLEEKRKRTVQAKAAYDRLRGARPADDPSRLAGLLRLALLLELEEKPRQAAPLYMEVMRHSERGSSTFETARKRVEVLTGDKSLIGR